MWRIASSRNTTEFAPFHFGSEGGKYVPISPAATAPSSASVNACSSTSPSECPARPLSCGNSTPPILQGIPGLNSCESQPYPILIFWFSVLSCELSLSRYHIATMFTGEEELG